MTGRTGGRACSGSHPAWPDQAPAARTTAAARSSLAGGGAHAGDPPALEQGPGHLVAGPHLDPLRRASAASSAALRARGSIEPSPAA